MTTGKSENILREMDRRIARLETLVERLSTLSSPPPTGTAFPTGVPTGFRFYRSDEKKEYYYNGSGWSSSWGAAIVDPTDVGNASIGTHPAYGGTYGALWFNGNDAAGQYNVLFSSSYLFLNAPTGGTIHFRINNTSLMDMNNSGLTQVPYSGNLRPYRNSTFLSTYSFGTISPAVAGPYTISSGATQTVNVTSLGVPNGAVAVAAQIAGIGASAGTSIVAYKYGGSVWELVAPISSAGAANRDSGICQVASNLITIYANSGNFSSVYFTVTGYFI